MGSSAGLPPRLTAPLGNSCTKAHAIARVAGLSATPSHRNTMVVRSSTVFSRFIIPKLGHMPLGVKGAYALRFERSGFNPAKVRTIVPSRFEAADESPCSATAMRKATRRMTQLYDDALASAGLRSTQYAILEELHRQADAPPTMGELAETLVLDRSALGHNLRPLERDGLIALVAGDDTRRRH